MGEMVSRMLNQVMLAYAHGNVDLARVIARQDDEVDTLYAQVFGKIMKQMAQVRQPGSRSRPLTSCCASHANWNASATWPPTSPNASSIW